MKEYKTKVLNELEKLTEDYHSVQLRFAAERAGIKHLKTQECMEILKAFTKKHPEYLTYRAADNQLDSFFCSVFVSDNASFPYEAHV